MNRKSDPEEIRGYCAQCSCWCPTISEVKDGVFIQVKPDKEHGFACSLCPKGLSGPELVYSKQRLQYPVRRTKPKGDPDAGWERITWDEALGTIANRLNEIKTDFGPEAIAVASAGFSGSPMAEVRPWLNRLANAFGTPNSISTTHICQWHRDGCSVYTYGAGAVGRAEFEKADCILIWGNNPHATRPSLLPLIKLGLDRGAKLIVIDPRKTEIAAMADDLWLQVCPGTDGALALSMINVIIEENLYDIDFVRDWTTAPFLVRDDTKNFLKASDIDDKEASSSYVVMDFISKEPMAYGPGILSSANVILDCMHTVRLVGGEEIRCKTVFQLLRELASEYHPSKTEALTKIPESKIRSAARVFATIKPACWYSWNGIEQSINASQTNRAICILYALTGNYDAPGGNVILSKPTVNPIEGRDFLSREAERKRLGLLQRPLGPAAISRSTQAYEVFRTILTGKPYPIKALLGFGGNTIMSNAPSALAKEAISQLDFHVQVELFLSPTAELADIVLPAASSWESWHVGTNIGSLGDKAHIQLRPAVVAPQHESWPDMKIIFELAKRLGLGDKFWDGDIETGFNYQFAPANITVEQLRMNPGGISIDLPMEYRKYSKKDDAGNFSGFSTPSKRIELYSSTFKEHGYEPLPVWKDTTTVRFTQANPGEDYPLILINGKVIEYCHSQHRALPSLRRRVPHPFLEINPLKARELDCDDGDWVILETPQGSITLQAKITDRIPYDVVCTQNGWWQACHELNLPGYDPYSPTGANVNLIYSVEEIDPISGSLPLKGYPCRVRKKG